MIDLGVVERSLRADGWAPFAPPDWLVESWRDPAAFAAALAAWHDGAGATPLKSVPGSGYDLFHDLVRRHLGTPTPALVIDGAGAPRELWFAQLAWAAGQRAEAWRRAGAQPGQVVALARPLGVELVVSLLAALQLGLVFSLVPPSGRRLARARLEALAPAFVDADAAYATRVPDGVPLVPSSLPVGDEAGLTRSHLYRPGQPVALLFDAEAPMLPRPLSCDAAWLGALRDGAVTLGLRAGDAVAAPDLPLVGAQPALLFAALMSGATWVHLTLDELAHAPERLVARPLAALGVGARLRRLVCERRLALGGRVASWFRDPIASTALEPWQDFVAAAGLQAAPATNVRWSAALGGATLFSPRRAGVAHADVLPAAGATHGIVELARDDAPASGVGRLALTPAGADEPVVTAAVVAPRGRGWLAGGAMPACPGGRAYPTAEALAAVATVPGCRAATVVIDPDAGGGARVVLLVFGAGAAVAEAAVRDALEADLGPDQLPDEIACFPLLPRRDDAGAPDARWCHAQYRSGELSRKSHDELFRLLSRLRGRVVQKAEESP